MLRAVLTGDSLNKDEWTLDLLSFANCETIVLLFDEGNYNRVSTFTNGCCHLAVPRNTISHISNRAWHEYVNNLMSFHMQVSFSYSRIPSAPWKPKCKGPMHPQLCKPVSSSTNIIRSVKLTYTEMKQSLFCV